MSKISDVYNAALRALLGFACLTKVTLAINAASAATFKTTGTTSYTCDGIWFTKAALAAQAFTAGHAVQAIGTTRYYLVTLDSAGTVRTIQGTSGGGMPDAPANQTPIGAIKIVTNASTTFTPGTTALDAAGVTATYIDLCVLPANQTP
jgi:hypothetical protein